MTILPKKKPGNGKGDSEGGETCTSVHHSTSREESSREERRLNRNQNRNSPPRWSQNSSRDDKRTNHQPTAGFDEFEPLETGPSHSKRRHRASPHRTTRKHRNGVSSPSVPSGCQSPTSQSQSSNSSNASGVGSPQGSASQQAQSQDDCSGYNSGDEYGAESSRNRTEEEWLEHENKFEKNLLKKGYTIKKMKEDGACLFRSVADQVFGDQDMHDVVRKHCMDYLAKNSDYYSQYITEDFEKYVSRKRAPNSHGNHIEMQALSEIYNRTIEVHHSNSAERVLKFVGAHVTDNEPIRLSYHRNVHYNSIVDPYKATIGVGLGLPEFQPGLADKKLLCEATSQSEALQIEQAMLEDKLRATDCEATDNAIEEQVARASYIEWLRDNERRAGHSSASSTQGGSGSSSKYQGSRSATVTSATATSIASPQRGLNSPGIGVHGVLSNGRHSNGNSPQHQGISGGVTIGAAVEQINESSNTLPSDDRGYDGRPGSSESGTNRCSNEFNIYETASFFNHIPPDGAFALSEWDDAKILAQVLAASQQEYLDQLRKNKHNSAANSPSRSSEHDPDAPSTSAGPSTSRMSFSRENAGGDGPSSSRVNS